MNAPRIIRMSPPLLGYNNNVRHRGQVFHIQTEDSGVGSPRIMTHLFADGGRIVSSLRTDYSEHIGRGDMVDVVKRLMKEQHKAMFVALRSGALDERIGFDDEAPPPSTVEQPHLQSAAEEMQRKSVRAPAGTIPPGGPLLDAPKQSSRPALASSPGGERAYAAPRPASIFSAGTPTGSIFGEVGGIDEKSLDDAILSYLAEEPKQSEPDGSGS